MGQERVTARILKGFKDCLPDEALSKQRMLNTLREVFESFGFPPIETPHLEYTDVLIQQTEGEIGKQLFRFEDQGGRDVCLRFDLTVPLARYTVQHKNELGLPFKRYAIGNVFRGERPQFGRYREFTQCDIDFLGTTSRAADAEIMQVIASALQALGVEQFVIKYSSRRLMNGLAESLGIPEEVTPEVIREIDKLAKVGEAEVRAALVSKVGLSEEHATRFLDLTKLSAASQGTELFDALEALEIKSEIFAAGVQELREIHELLVPVGKIAEHLEVDLSIARGLGYYTGFVFETFLKELPELGSVASGGRYDDLTKSYSKDDLSGVGGSVGLSRLMAGLDRLGLQSTSATPATVLVVGMTADELVRNQAHARELRQQGVAVEVYPDTAKLKKQFQYANKKGHRFIFMCGEDEHQRGVFSVKNMNTGEQLEFGSIAECASHCSSEK